MYGLKRISNRVKERISELEYMSVKNKKIQTKTWRK